MKDHFWELYQEWLKNKNSSDSNVNISKENYYYRFVFGDIAPKQAWRSYSKYIEPHIIQEYNESGKLYQGMQ
jgi:hypothetical protein